jgi:ABC-2 type transport system ATP-binding protein
MGKTIVISSHILLEMAEMCSEVAIIQGGKLVVSGNMDEVSQRLGKGRQLEIRVLDRIEEAVQLLQETPDISNVSHAEGDLIQADFEGDDRALHKILAKLITQDIPVVSFAPRSSGGLLEEVFMNITEGSLPS